MQKPFPYAAVLIAIFAAIGLTAWLIFLKPGQTPEVVLPAEPTAHRQPRNTAQPPAVTFRDVTKESGVNFVHVHGGFGQKLLPETMGSGVLAFDYNQDGHQDLLFVNSNHWPEAVHAHYSAKYATVQKPVHAALYENDGTGHFKDVTAANGLAFPCYGMGAAAGDIDNDGYPDLLITSLQRVFLMHNEQGKGFRDVTEEAGILKPEPRPSGSGDSARQRPLPNGRGSDQKWSSSAAFLDYNLDGKLDLFIAHYVKWTPETDLFCKLTGNEKSYCQPFLYEGEHCQLLRNLDGKRFEDVSAKAGIHITGRQGRVASKALGVAVHDYNDDGWLDIAVANDTNPNLLFRNNKDGTFAEMSAAKGIVLINEGGGARGAMGIGWAYYRDGQTLGLGIANFSNEMNGLLRYDRENDVFIDCAVADGVGGPSRLPLKFGLFFFDYDLDGRLDFFTSNGHIEPEIERIQAAVKYAQPAQLFWHAGVRDAGCYRAVSADYTGPDLFKPRVGRGACFADIDNDGDLDIILNNNNQPATVLRNEARRRESRVTSQESGVGDQDRQSIRLRFVGQESNRDGFGCRVKLTSGGVLQQAELNSGGSYMSQHEAVLTFGLGQNTKAEIVEIRWPTPKGQITKLENLEAGFTYVVDEKKGIVSKTPFGTVK